MRKALGAVTVLIAVAGSAAAQVGEPIAGEATVVDSDALRVDGKSLLLWGIESVERPQFCTIDGHSWACYEAAVRSLQTIVGVADVTCTPEGEPDGYGRILVTCFVDGINVNEALVRAGFALAKRDETEAYVAAEDAAKAEGIGLWQGEFIHPAEFRLMSAIRVDRP